MSRSRRLASGLTGTPADDTCIKSHASRDTPVRSGAEFARALRAAADLPVLWDADVLLGGADGTSKSDYLLCEINVSSVSPYPESATAEIVAAVQALLICP